MMHHRPLSKLLTFILVIIPILVLPVSSCGIAETITGITPTPETPSPTKRVCPPNIDLGSLDGLRINPTFIVVLLDTDSVSSDTLEYVTGEKSPDILGFVGNFLPKVLGPGDQYSIFLFGYRGYEAAKLDRYNSKIAEAPEIVATPQPHKTLTPVPTPTLSSAVLENQVANNEYDVTVEAQHATATQMAFEHDCEMLAYDTTYKVTATAWSVTKQAEANEIATQIVVAQNERRDNVEAFETPFAQNVVYEGLSHVTIDFENQCKYYERCILVVFDELLDWRIETPDYLDISLEKVEVISVMPQCEDIIQPSCRRLQDLWTPQFESYGASSVEYHNGERLEQFLIDYLRR